MSKTPSTDLLDANESDSGAEAIRFIEGAWNDAARQWDVGRLTAIYTDDALFYGGRPGHSVGSDAVRGYFESYVGVLRSATLKFSDQVLMKVGPDAFVAQGYGRFEFRLSEGGSSANTLRTTLVLMKRGDQWKIAQHHFSATPEAPPF